MMFLMYMIPLVAWTAFTYHMHHSGGRPTTITWWAFMTGLGTFELSKGIAGVIGNVPTVSAALGAGVLAAGVVLVVHARRTWTAEPSSAIPATGR
jgi:hypothetical protein